MGSAAGFAAAFFAVVVAAAFLAAGFAAFFAGEALKERGANTAAVEVNLTDPEAAAQVFDQAQARLGDITGLVMCQCESVESGLLNTTLESFTATSRSMRVLPGC